MVEITPLEAKIIKQVEYYFGDINLSRDKFMKEAIKENDGWISMDTMMKFNRLKALSEDADFIKKSVSKSSLGLVQVGDNGLRRNPDFEIPESLGMAFEGLKEQSVYIKGFNLNCTLDEIIEWLESVGGKTLNVHMRRFPKDKKFKGSVFAVFAKKEDAEKFLKSEDAAKYKGKDMIRLLQEEYWNRKKSEKNAKLDAQVKKQAALDSNREAQLNARMIMGALLEITGLPKARKNSKTSESSNGKSHEHLDLEDQSNNVEEISGEKEIDGEKSPNSIETDKSASPVDEANTEDVCETPTVLNLKQWLVEKLGTHLPVGWIDVEPAEGKAIVRFKLPNTAEKAWVKLTEVFDNKPVVYQNCELSGRIISGREGDEERNHWKSVLAAQQQKAQKRRAGRQGGGHKNFDSKRRRTN